MSKTIKVDVVDSEKFIFSGEVEYFVVSGFEGELGIYPNHIPIIVKLKPGILRIQLPNEAKQSILAISGGFLEVSNNKAIILADIVERTDALDESRLIEQRNEALNKINTQSDTSNKSFVSLEIAIAQLKALEYMRNHVK